MPSPPLKASRRVGGGFLSWTLGLSSKPGNRLRANVLEQEEGHRDPPRASQWTRVGQTREKLGLHPRKQPRLRGACDPSGRGSQAEAEGLGGLQGHGVTRHIKMGGFDQEADPSPPPPRPRSGDGLSLIPNALQSNANSGGRAALMSPRSWNLGRFPHLVSIKVSTDRPTSNNIHKD